MSNINPFLGRSRTINENNRNREEASTSRNSTSSISRSIIERVLNRSVQYNQNIEEIIDPQQDYLRFQTNGLRILNPEILYNRGLLESRTQFFRHSREIFIQCIGNQVKKLNLI